MNQVTRALPRVRHQPRLRLLRVARVDTPSPRMRRVTLTGDELDGFVTLAADDHVKLLFAERGQDRPVLPTIRDGGLVYPAGTAPLAARDYTPRRFDPLRLELQIEFVLHGDGPASRWAAQAAAGQWVGVGGPRGSRLMPDGGETFVLVGDETALPAIARQLEEMRPGVGALVLIEVADRQEERHLPTAANASVRWLHRDGAAPGRSGLLERALRDVTLPDGELFAWVAGEIETVRRVRTYLMEEEGMRREQIRAAGYWRLGEPGAHAKVDE